MWPTYNDSSKLHQKMNSHKWNFCDCTCIGNSRNQNQINASYSKLAGIIAICPAAPPISKLVQEKIRNGILAEELTQAMLRDILYWSIFTNRIKMAKVLILHIRSRICAALTCAAILRNCAVQATSSDQGHRYRQHAKDFEMYATDCINTCYSKSERKACELLIREQPLFGKITCMQVSFIYISLSNMKCDL